MMYYTPPMYYPMYYNGGGSSQGGGGSQYAERSGNTDGRDMPRMYYNGGSSGGGNSGGGRSGGSGGGNSGGSGSSGGSSQYSEREFPSTFQDEREGRSPRSRRMYKEAKQTHQDKATQMRELEKYMQELTQDIVEMVEGSTAEEKQYLSKRVSALANKLAQLND